jgi:hypothetical protein
LVGLEAGGKVSAPFDMVMRVLRELRLAVTLDPAHSLVTSPRPAPKAIYWKPEA